LLLTGFVLVVMLAGVSIGVLTGQGTTGTVIALVFAAIMAFTSYWKSDSIALAVSRAVPADEQEYQRLHNLVEGLCIAAGLPKPRVYIILPRGAIQRMPL
jgi:heat shock protein HtpX